MLNKFKQNQMFFSLKSNTSSFHEPKATQLSNSNLWNQWLAGLIDGDGCFYISKSGQISLEITVATEDWAMLQTVKQNIGGTLKARSGSQSVRLRVFKKILLCSLVDRVNGYIRLPSRYNQFKKVCLKLNRPCHKPEPLRMPTGYIAGLFDADGSVTLTVQRAKTVMSTLPGSYGKYMRLVNARGFHQLSLHIVSKDARLLKEIQQCMGFGSVCSDMAIKPSAKKKRPNILYRWYFRNVDDVEQWLAYIRRVPLRSQKNQRCFLLRPYFELKSQKMHLENLENHPNKQWDRFCRSWFKIDHI